MLPLNVPGSTLVCSPEWRRTLRKNRFAEERVSEFAPSSHSAWFVVRHAFNPHSRDRTTFRTQLATAKLQYTLLFNHGML